MPARASPWPSHRARLGRGEKPQPLEGFFLASSVCVRAKRLGAPIHPRQSKRRRRAINLTAPSRLDTVRRRPAKDHRFPRLGESCILSGLVEAWLKSPP
jgi:hypothetical protein